MLPSGLVGCYASSLLCQSFAQGFLGPLFTSLPLLGFFGQHSCYASPFHYFISRASSAHLLLPYLFYSHRLFLDPFDFLGPITTYLPFITFWAYWPLGWPIEFTNLVLGLPRPIYLFFYSHRITTLFIRLPRPIYSFFISFHSCGLPSHQSCHFSLLGLFPYSLTIFPSSPSPYCWASSIIGPFVKSGHQQNEIVPLEYLEWLSCSSPKVKLWVQNWVSTASLIVLSRTSLLHSICVHVSLSINSHLGWMASISFFYSLQHVRHTLRGYKWIKLFINNSGSA